MKYAKSMISQIQKNISVINESSLIMISVVGQLSNWIFHQLGLIAPRMNAKTDIHKDITMTLFVRDRKRG